MKKILLIFGLVVSLTSCKDDFKEKGLVKKNSLEPVVEVKELTSDFMTWWTYQSNNIGLHSDFEPLDENSNLISKTEFLNKLTSGNFVPVEMKTDTLKTYKLYGLPANVDKDISSTLKNVSTVVLKLHKMEGKKFPNFTLVDLKGKHYDNESLEGKTTILKTWFIACKPCIQEMPELNKLVDDYKNYNRFQFLSLALDEEKPLEEFLKKIEFKYAVASEQKDLIVNKLKLNAYPTHLVINENGEIEKVFQKASDLIVFLEKNEPIKNKHSDAKLPPPAPVEDSHKNDA